MKKNKNNLNLVIAIGILWVIGCSCPPPDANKNNAAPSPASSPATQAPSNGGNTTSANEPFNYEKDGLQLVSAKWQKGGFGTVGLWKVTIKNVSDKPLGDIKFSTEYYSETKNVVSKGGTKGLVGKDTIEKIVPPKSTKTFDVNDGFVSDEAHTAELKLESWRIIN
jgi:hypothetical protein